VEIVDKIPTKEIIKLYKDSLSIDVGNYFKGIEYVEIRKCRDTLYRYYYPDTIFGHAEFYEKLQQNEFYYTPRIWDYGKARKHIRNTDQVLDIGCGAGIFIEQLQNSGIDARGLELNPKAIEECKRKNLHVQNELIQDHSIQNPGKYDVVCAFHVLEHIYDIKSFIDASCKCLKKGGKLIFAVPNNNPYFLKYDKMHTLNLPPHHAGLWSKEAFNLLPKCFPISCKNIYVEPLYNRHNYIESYIKNKGSLQGMKLFKKLHPGLINRLFSPLRLFVQGTSLLAVFEK
jgi:SAM-dependent methyltransferase